MNALKPLDLLNDKIKNSDGRMALKVESDIITGHFTASLIDPSNPIYVYAKAEGYTMMEAMESLEIFHCNH